MNENITTQELNLQKHSTFGPVVLLYLWIQLGTAIMRYLTLFLIIFVPSISQFVSSPFIGISYGLITYCLVLTISFATFKRFIYKKRFNYIQPKDFIKKATVLSFAFSIFQVITFRNELNLEGVALFATLISKLSAAPLLFILGNKFFVTSSDEIK